MPRFVLEIGTEELPPRFFPPAMAQLREGIVGVLERLRLTHGAVRVMGTPRRLAVTVEEVSASQAASTREERGPATKVAFKDGQPTKAAEGFARRYGLTAQDLVVKATEAGEYVFAVVHEAEAPAGPALAGALPELISSLSFPKSMRWGSTSQRFGRPVRWVVALLGAEVISFPWADVQSGREARGHPVLVDEMLSVSSAESYEKDLGAHFVVVDPERRRTALAQQLLEIAESQDAVVMDDGLLDETVYLVEWPTCGLGSFDPVFLTLPRAVLVEEMRHVQSYFPMQNSAGELVPNFIAVRDGGRGNLDGIIRGWEHVLVAKLIDASFFYENDLKKPLADRVEALRGVVFQEKLGTMYDKVVRMQNVAGTFDWLSAEDTALLERSIVLCKADLTTEVVTELSNLQGTMGGVYARNPLGPEHQEVAEAISEHYHPRFAGDSVPGTRIGLLVALADKIDTLSALFAIGATPTGSADPYGLRREATGIIRLLFQLDERPSLRMLVGSSLSVLQRQIGVPGSDEYFDARQQVLDFVRQRLEVILRDEEGIRYDLCAAALSPEFARDNQEVSVRDGRERAIALQELSQGDEFLPLVLAATRVANIVRNSEKGKDPKTTLFSENAEWTLYRAWHGAVNRYRNLGNHRDYMKRFRIIVDLRDPVNQLFEDVLVMDEVQERRENRLALLNRVNELFSGFADFTLVVQG